MILAAMFSPMTVAAFASAFIFLASTPMARTAPLSCADDYSTVETIRGTIIDIKPAPEPFRSADIFLTGPAPCSSMWMQVLKHDAENCRIGGFVEAEGVITQDAENNSWEIHPGKNEYMTLGDDFTCG
jgi:hypothetical protein